MENIIRNQIIKARDDAGKTQQDLADHLGKKPASISDIERGRVHVSAKRLFKIAEYLDKPIEYFFGIKQNEPIVDEIRSSLQTSDSNTIKDTLEIIRYNNELRKYVKYLNKKYTVDDKINHEDLMKFYSIISPYSDLLKTKWEEMLETKKWVERSLKSIE